MLNVLNLAANERQNSLNICTVHFLGYPCTVRTILMRLSTTLSTCVSKTHHRSLNSRDVSVRSYGLARDKVGFVGSRTTVPTVHHGNRCFVNKPADSSRRLVSGTSNLAASADRCRTRTKRSRPNHGQRTRRNRRRVEPHSIAARGRRRHVGERRRCVCRRTGRPGRAATAFVSSRGVDAFA